MTGMLQLWIIAAALMGQTGGDALASARAEREPEKRYWKALEVAVGQVGVAREKYEKGLLEEFRASLILIEQAVRLSDETLRGTGKDPAKSPKHFKRAEQKIRDIVKKLAGLEEAVGIDDRSVVKSTRESLQKIQEEIVMDIVGRRR